ncbi:MAG: ABC transporter ATP-binding protein [Tenericutes bacterium]|nr:ABC transporter ATP-binding protein [Mycoplasmatota bacterium]
MAKKLLQVKHLKTSFFTHLGEVQAVRDISFDLEEGDILGIVGESGSGKSVTSLSIIGLVDDPGEIVSGSVLFDGKDLTKLKDRELNRYRGNDISMIFQDPMTSINPVYSVGNQITEVIRTHSDMSRHEAKERAIELLTLVGIPEPETRIKSFPHEFSGGMRQRVLIAMALANNPKLLIADEPTTALDVTIQAQILDLMRNLKDKTKSSIIFITHDLGVIAEICNKVIVMYGGKIMEKADIFSLYAKPQHPYTVGLMQSVPKPVTGPKKRLIPIAGSPPDLLKPPTGCPFSPRCKHALGVCLEEAAPLYKISETQSASCWLHDKSAPTVEGYVKCEPEVEEVSKNGN